ncbi:MAG: hypothetical protein KAR05_00130 [Candidatus Omnitrophica bacterium]|nr:hypothetical protein [Candidatus Omnitrophota bacterium]
MINKVISFLKNVGDILDKVCHFYMSKRYGAPVVVFEIKKQSGKNLFYLKNTSNSPVYEISVENSGLKCKHVDSKWKSKEGDDKFLLKFSDISALNGQEEIETNPKIFIPQVGECFISDKIWSPFNINAENILKIKYRDQYRKKWIITEMKISWNGYRGSISTQFVKR